MKKHLLAAAAAFTCMFAAISVSSAQTAVFSYNDGVGTANAGTYTPGSKLYFLDQSRVYAWWQRCKSRGTFLLVRAAESECAFQLRDHASRRYRKPVHRFANSGPYLSAVFGATRGQGFGRTAAHDSRFGRWILFNR